MMQDDFKGILDFILGAEGGWSNNPDDTGGCTMAGVTLPVYRNYKHNAGLTCADLQKISSIDVAGVYQKLYWLPVRGDELPAGIDLIVMDMAVNAGVSASAQLLQGVIGTNIDGAIGAHTIACLLKQDVMQVIDKLTTAQDHYYRTRATFSTFGEGWLNRLADRETAALKLACAVPAPTMQMMVSQLRQQIVQPVAVRHPAVMSGSRVHMQPIPRHST